MQQLGQIRRIPRRQSGASAVEFALIFPMLFGVTYAIVVYSFFFIVSQSLNYAAQNAAEAAVSIDPRQSVTDYRADVRTAVINTVNSNMRFLATRNRSLVSISEPIFCGSGGGSDASCPIDGGDAVVVKVLMDASSDPGNRLFAQMTLPLLGSFPPIPVLRAQAVARL